MVTSPKQPFSMLFRGCLHDRGESAFSLPRLEYMRAGFFIIPRVVPHYRRPENRVVAMFEHSHRMRTRSTIGEARLYRPRHWMRSDSAFITRLRTSTEIWNLQRWTEGDHACSRKSSGTAPLLSSIE